MQQLGADLGEHLVPGLDLLATLLQQLLLLQEDFTVALQDLERRRAARHQAAVEKAPAMDRTAGQERALRRGPGKDRLRREVFSERRDFAVLRPATTAAAPLNGECCARCALDVSHDTPA